MNAEVIRSDLISAEVDKSNHLPTRQETYLYELKVGDVHLVGSYAKTSHVGSEVMVDFNPGHASAHRRLEDADEAYKTLKVMVEVSSQWKPEPAVN